MQTILIRPAQTADAGRLTEIALSAKASWGYAADFMAACRDELTMTPAVLAARQVWVAENAGRISGMIALRPHGTDGFAELEHFFVDPSFQKNGIGRALFKTLLDACREQDISRLELDADPFAEPIYLRLGFTTIGRAPSQSIAGRFLPRMALSLAPA